MNGLPAPCPDCSGARELRVVPAHGEPYSILCHCYEHACSIVEAATMPPPSASTLPPPDLIDAIAIRGPEDDAECFALLRYAEGHARASAARYAAAQ